MLISVTGTPGTGKTKLAKLLSRRLGIAYVDLNHLVKKYQLHDGFDRRKKSYIVDPPKMVRFLKKKGFLSEAGVLDSHLSHEIPPHSIDICIVTTCELKELARRLKKRGYSQKKVRENLDAEIFQVCAFEAKEKGHRVLKVDTTQGIKIDAVLRKL